ncbi:MAG: DUF2971 domain-containing protein [Proteobacteria bacterium]|nr:DUF2971 domain-containing protein [Pseudomonadota bacterium]MBU1570201.1 DUF2971 domain-containing protein [Pseudomonadota bacterium]
MAEQIPADNDINENTPLIKYMDFWKFEKLLKDSAIYFNRVDNLNKEDFYEGTLTKEIYDCLIDKIYNHEMLRFVTEILSHPKPSEIFISDIKITGNMHKDLTNIRNRFQKFYDHLKQWLFVNCWCIGENELNTMWNSYTTKHEGIAIKSTFKRIKQSLHKEQIKDGGRIRARKVNYCDYDEAFQDEAAGNAPLFFRLGGIYEILKHMLFTKTKYYETERELRLLYEHPKLPRAYDLLGSEIDLTISNKDELKLIKVYPDVLISKMILHPGADSNFQERAKAIVTETRHLHNMSIDKITISNINSSPYRL